MNKFCLAGVERVISPFGTTKLGFFASDFGSCIVAELTMITIILKDINDY